MSTPGATPDQDPVLALADAEDDAYDSAVLDEGHTLNEREVRSGRFGLTADEEAEGESLEQRLREEEPDPAATLVLDGGDSDSDDPDLPADQPSGGSQAGELLDDEVGDIRAGRLVEPDEGARGDEESSAVALDAGVDGGAASAEEAAVHVVADPWEDDAS